VRRVLRIFPLYYAALFGCLVLVPRFVAAPGMTSDVADSLWYWSYLFNVRIAFSGWPEFGFIGHFWTLALEEQFYVAWPFVVLACTPARLARFCIGLIVGAFTLRLFLFTQGLEVAAYVLMPARVDTLAVGALVATLAHRPAGLRRVASWAAPVAWATGSVLGMLFWVRRGLDVEDPVVGTIGFSLIAMFFASILVRALTAECGHSLDRFLRLPALRALGTYSYGLYVIHHPLLFLLPRSWSLQSLQTHIGSYLPAWLLYLLLMAGATFILASVTWHGFERPFLDLKETLAPRQQARSSVAEA
jgi:peptidoglycan/LPS O-acetylase OafA/YrhL